MSERPPVRVLFVFDWLVVGGEETEVCLLARALDPRRYEIHVLACFENGSMSPLTANRLRDMGVPLDTACYELDDEGRARYIAGLIVRGGFEVVVACQGVQHPYRALQLLAPEARPPLVEHGGIAAEVHRNPKDLTAAYVGVSRNITDEALRVMPDPSQVHLIPSMVNLAEFEGHDREVARAELGFGPRQRVVGWVGRLDRKKRVQDVVEAAALLLPRLPEARFLLVGGPDAFMPEYETELKALARARGIQGGVVFTGDRPDVPRLLSAMDALVWLSRGEGMPHVILEAGAARLPVVATRDGGTPDLIEDGQSGLFVPHESPPAVAAALERVLAERGLGARLGNALRRMVEERYATSAVCGLWEALFADLVAVRYEAPAGVW